MKVPENKEGTSLLRFLLSGPVLAFLVPAVVVAGGWGGFLVWQTTQGVDPLSALIAVATIAIPIHLLLTLAGYLVGTEASFAPRRFLAMALVLLGLIPFLVALMLRPPKDRPVQDGDSSSDADVTSARGRDTNRQAFG